MIHRRTVICLLASLSWLSLGASEHREPRELEIESQGYSRFEIEGGNVIAYYPEAVTFKYMGFEVSARSLRYDQAQELAVAAGGVYATSADYTLNAGSVRFDGQRGTVSAGGGVQADAGKQGFSLSGSEAEISFPPDAARVVLDSSVILVSGGVEIRDRGGSLLQCTEAAYEGASALLSISGEFNGRYVLTPALEARGDLPGVEAVGFSGSDLQARVAEDGLLSEVRFSNVTMDTGAACFAGRSVSAWLEPMIPGRGEVWRFILEGDPARAQVGAKGATYYLRSNELSGEVDANGPMKLQLAGEAELWSASQFLRCSRAVVTETAGGFEISLPEGLTAAYNLSEFSSSGPFNLRALNEPSS